MTTTELLARLRALDVRMSVAGGRLRINAPKGRITSELESALVAGKEDLVRVLAQEVDPSAAAGDANEPRLVPSARGLAARPLSFLQERLWMLDRMQPGLTAYNFAALLTPAGTVRIACVQAAVARVIARHEILRSRFVVEDGVPVAHVVADDSAISIEDLRAYSAGERDRVVAGAADAAARRPFQLADEAPVRFTILRTGDEHASLLISGHHIALDSWSFGRLAREVQAEYDAIDAGRPAVDAPTLQYADFAEWQRRMAEHPRTAASLAYWTTRLAALPQRSVFPTDRTAASEAAGAGAALDFRWSTELSDAVRGLARACDATPYMVLLAAVAAVLARHTGQTDLALGSPVGTRDRPELEGVIGPILNPLVIRFDVSDDPTFATLVARARDAVLEGHTHQEVPFERIVQVLNPGRSLGHAPLFQTAVVLHNAPDAAEVTLTGGGSIYDLTVFARERGGVVTGAIEYRTDLYDATTIARIVDHLQRLLAGAAHDRGLRISELPLLGADELAQVTTGFNATTVAVDRATIVEQFARTAAAHPDAVAVIASGETLTYAALDARSDAVAARLRALGAGPGSLVGLATRRTSALPVAALGILKTGAAYVPVDLAYPRDRVDFMLRDSGAGQVVTSRSNASAFAGLAADVVVVEDLGSPTELATPQPAHLAGPRPCDIAYLIYTSGSTGTPKGVRVPHSAVNNFLYAMRERVGFTAADVLVAVTSASFDISVLEMFLPLVQGGQLVVAGEDVASDGARLAALLTSSGATMLQATPSGWRLLMNARWNGNRALTAITGGEPMPPDLADWLRPRVAVLWNGYGPTETTVYSTMARLDDGEPITIGTPIANTRVYVLDARGTPTPIGAPGEICIAGDGVALGYHDRAALTTARFVADPFVAGAPMYRTGDVGRWRADGRLDHLGRADGQVKVRGYRIEPGEIEATLAQHELVRAAVVGVRAGAADDPRIVAWVQFEDDEECTASELRRYLRARLPEFMIPAMVVPVDTFPLTPNGKVDRLALPDPFVVPRRALAAEAAPPRTPTECLIAEVWTRLLGVDRVGVHDSFFELGGHSLLAMRAAHEITVRTGRAIEPRLLFVRTLGQLAEACDDVPAVAAGGRA